MKTYVKGVSAAPPINMEYAPLRDQRAGGGERPSPGRERERIKEMLAPLVKEAVQKQLKEQQDYYRSRPSLAAKQMGQILGPGNMEKVLVPAVAYQVYGRLEDRMRHEWIRKGR